ncbi:hypothetical protein [Francisella salimarina]|uniref:hypothetical protein n=1 Tax=Francisella salimarina TaxID=2599927 RepID=UPI003D81706B
MLDSLEDIDINKIERVSTPIVLKIATLFENGDYENTIKLIEREFTENKYIDVNFLSYFIISQLSVDKSLKNSVAALDSLNNLYQKKVICFLPTPI